MRLVKRHIDRDGSGSVVLCPEEPEDMVSLTPPAPPSKPNQPILRDSDT